MRQHAIGVSGPRAGPCPVRAQDLAARLHRRDRTRPPGTSPISTGSPSTSFRPWNQATRVYRRARPGGSSFPATRGLTASRGSTSADLHIARPSVLSGIFREELAGGGRCRRDVSHRIAANTLERAESGPANYRFESMTSPVLVRPSSFPSEPGRTPWTARVTRPSPRRTPRPQARPATSGNTSPGGPNLSPLQQETAQLPVRFRAHGRHHGAPQKRPRSPRCPSRCPNTGCRTARAGNAPRTQRTRSTRPRPSRCASRHRSRCPSRSREEHPRYARTRASGHGTDTPRSRPATPRTTACSNTASRGHQAMHVRHLARDPGQAAEIDLHARRPLEPHITPRDPACRGSPRATGARNASWSNTRRRNPSPPADGRARA